MGTYLNLSPKYHTTYPFIKLLCITRFFTCLIKITHMEQKNKNAKLKLEKKTIAVIRDPAKAYLNFFTTEVTTILDGQSFVEICTTRTRDETI